MRTIPAIPAVLVITLLSGLSATRALAQEAAPSAGGLSANMGAVTLYKYRGQDQYINHSGEEKKLRPALQAGLDHDFGNGFYVGNWNSSVRLPSSSGTAHLEMDFYGGYRFETGLLAWDVGALRYQYPGSGVLNTTEVYAGATYGPATLKYSHTVSDRYFGLEGGKNTGYLNLAVNYPVSEAVALQASVGHTMLDGGARQASGLPDYTDYSLGLAWTAQPGLTVTAAVAGANQDDAWGYVNKPKAIIGMKYAF
ncbi:TorF family putative porin [Brachymonas sp. G13]|uniref:TorF family putative porin n=1 Tax=Brachymonas TaxID=28219 RepID=UPI0016A5CF7E|nr:TorF family putative porin [Brachymonas sp. J145]MEE1654350.1 TorF family putative porin [Brachymonas sp. J145]NLX16814.1 hypothetical protein [Ramlibacter sp.]